MAQRIRVGLHEIAEHFEALEDPRSDINQKHPLVSVIVIAMMAVLAGADGPTAIFLAAKLAPHLLGAIASAAYSYMALVPVIQPPIMKLLTTKTCPSPSTAMHPRWATSCR